MLSQTAEYALRAMAWLATHNDVTPIRTRDLARRTRIPEHYLAKILRRLVVAGVLESRKGVGGGFTLARPPDEIAFADVLAAVDYLPGQERCLFGWGACNPDDPCSLHPAWISMNEAFREWARTTTLADLGESHR